MPCAVVEAAEQGARIASRRAGIEAATPLEVAEPTKSLILVSLSQLLSRRSKRNARNTPRLCIPELAASISRIGLLQNLVVKTTLATHIAGELTMRGQAVILLDANPQGSSLDWTQRRSQQGQPRRLRAVGLASETLHQEAP